MYYNITADFIIDLYNNSDIQLKRRISSLFCILVDSEFSNIKISNYIIMHQGTLYCHYQNHKHIRLQSMFAIPLISH